MKYSINLRSRYEYLQATKNSTQLQRGFILHLLLQFVKEIKTSRGTFTCLCFVLRIAFLASRKLIIFLEYF